MTRLQWRDEFSVGIAEVDHEHRELIRLINSVHESIERSDSVVEVRSALGEISAQIAAHFALEEKNMQALRYSQLAEHKRDHEKLLDEIRDVMDACERALSYDRDDFLRRLNAWFEVHFRTHDARLHHAVSQGSSANEATVDSKAGKPRSK